MKAVITTLFFLFLLSGCTENNDTSVPSNNTYPYTIKTYENADKAWGFDILKENKTFIHQPHIPAISGNNGFKTKEQAFITAEFMVNKLQKGIMPPTLSIKELDSLGVLDKH